GRFDTPDPDHASANPRRPRRWNRYSYAGNDPVNHGDPRGLDFDQCGAFDSDSCEYLYPNQFDGLPSDGYNVQVDCDLEAMAYGSTTSVPGGVACSLPIAVYAGIVDGSHPLPPLPPPPPPPSCSIEVYNRPIEALHGLNLPGAQHGFIEFTDSTGINYFAEGQK